MWITLEQIEYLAAIRTEGSITAASQRLLRSKSAVYYAIKKLEEQVGFKLIETGQYRGSVTAKGEQFLSKAAPILSELEQLKSSAHRIATGVEMKLSISTTALFDLKSFNKAIKAVQHSYPDTEITIHREVLSGRKLLQKRLVDLSIFEGDKDDGFETKTIAEIKMHLVIAKDHPFLQLKKSSRKIDDLFAFPQVVQRSTLPDDDQHGVYQQSRRWTVSDLSAKRQIILDGLGWGRLPFHDIEDDLENGRLIVLSELEDPTLVPIQIGRRLGEDHGVVSAALWDIFG